MIPTRRDVLGLLGGVATVYPLVAVAQQRTGKVARIGMISSTSSDPLVHAFKLGLRELGYIEGDNINVEYRWVEGQTERYSSLAADLVELKVDVIVASSQAAIAAKQATSEIPIVMPIITDPVRLGLVASLARPGGNATGFATQNEELPGKWMELIKEIRPTASYDGSVQLKASEAAARSLDMQLQVVNVESLEDFVGAFAELDKNRAEALVVSSSALFYAHRTDLVDFVAKRRLPAIYHQSGFIVGAARLMSYGPDFRDLFRRSATYVDKILKGAKPADLPVQRPTKFELIINVKTAKALGINIPPALLARADEVIE